MIANDHGFESLFARQIASSARDGDAVLVVSGSGRSGNLLRAVERARHLRLPTFGLLGFHDGGPLRLLVDDAFVAASDDYRIIEDVHHSAAHSVAAALSAAAPGTGSKIAVLERDGVLCVPPEPAVGARAGGLVWLPGARAAIASLKRAGWTLLVLASEPGIARGEISAEQVRAQHERLNDSLSSDGARIDAFFLCPHDPSEACDCRKPGLGLLRAASEEFGFRPSDCAIIGGSPVDQVLGQRAGARVLLVGGVDQDGRGHARDLAGAAERLIRESAGDPGF